MRPDDRYGSRHSCHPGVSGSPQERTLGQSPRSAGEPLAGKAVLCDRSPFRGSDRPASDVAPLVQHVVHAALAYIVARRDRVLIFASPMSEPDINSVVECKSVCHARRLRPRKTASAVGFRSQASGRVAEPSCVRLRCTDAPRPPCMRLRRHLWPRRTARLAAPSGHGGKARPRICP
jgi:hypothetical protein